MGDDSSTWPLPSDHDEENKTIENDHYMDYLRWWRSTHALVLKANVPKPITFNDSKWDLGEKVHASDYCLYWFLSGAGPSTYYVPVIAKRLVPIGLIASDVTDETNIDYYQLYDDRACNIEGDA